MFRHRARKPYIFTVFFVCVRGFKDADGDRVCGAREGVREVEKRFSELENERFPSEYAGLWRCQVDDSRPGFPGGRLF